MEKKVCIAIFFFKVLVFKSSVIKLLTTPLTYSSRQWFMFSHSNCNWALFMGASTFRREAVFGSDLDGSGRIEGEIRRNGRNGVVFEQGFGKADVYDRVCGRGGAYKLSRRLQMHSLHRQTRNRRFSAMRMCHSILRDLYGLWPQADWALPRLGQGLEAACEQGVQSPQRLRWKLRRKRTLLFDKHSI